MHLAANGASDAPRGRMSSRQRLVFAGGNRSALSDPGATSPPSQRKGTDLIEGRSAQATMTTTASTAPRPLVAVCVNYVAATMTPRELCGCRLEASPGEPFQDDVGYVTPAAVDSQRVSTTLE